MSPLQYSEDSQPNEQRTFNKGRMRVPPVRLTSKPKRHLNREVRYSGNSPRDTTVYLHQDVPHASPGLHWNSHHDPSHADAQPMNERRWGESGSRIPPGLRINEPSGSDRADRGSYAARTANQYSSESQLYQKDHRDYRVTIGEVGGPLTTHPHLRFERMLTKDTSK